MTNETHTDLNVAVETDEATSTFSEVTSNVDMPTSNNNVATVQNFILKIDKSLPSLQDVIQKYIEFAVQRNGGAKDRTAREIGIDRKTLYKKIKMAGAAV